MAQAEDAPRSRPFSGFSVVRQGYDRNQVKRHVQRLETQIQSALYARDQAQQHATELAAELEMVRRDVDALTERLNTPTRADIATHTLEVARAQAAEITARAQASAEHAWAAARQASDQLRDQHRSLLDKVEKQHSELCATHDQIMAAARAQAEELTVAAQLRRQEIDDAAERDRARIEREFAESMKARRMALDEEIEAIRADCTRQAEQRIRTAEDQAAQRLAAAAIEVDRLTALRDQLAEQLRTTQKVIDEIMSELQPADAEADLLIDGGSLVPSTTPSQERVLPLRVASQRGERAANAP